MAGNKVYVQGDYVDVHDNEVVNLSIDKVGTLRVDEAKVMGTQPQEEKAAMPEVVATEQAMRYWTRLQASGFVNDDFQLQALTTRKQAMYIADLFAEALGLRSKWKVFEQFWDIRNLAQEKWEMQESGKMPNRYDDIDKIFAE